MMFSLPPQLQPQFPSLLQLFSSALEDTGSRMVPFYALKYVSSRVHRLVWWCGYFFAWATTLPSVGICRASRDHTDGRNHNLGMAETIIAGNYTRAWKHSGKVPPDRYIFPCT